MRRMLLVTLVLTQAACATRESIDPVTGVVTRRGPWVCRPFERHGSGDQVPAFDPNGDPRGAIVAIAVAGVVLVVLGTACAVTRVPRLLTT